MPGLIVTVGGKLDKSYEAALAQAAAMAKRADRQMQTALEYAPTQLGIVNRALKNLPAESLMRPRLEAMKTSLTSIVGGAGTAAGAGFFSNFFKSFKGHQAMMGASQMIHSVRATFDALVAGINPTRVLAYELPQFLQSLILIGSAAVKVFLSLAAAIGSIAAIIAAPFIYFWRVNSLAESLSKFRLPDLNTEYISRLDRAAESWRKIANAIGDAVREWNGATAAARRENEALQAKLALQQELDEIAKARRIEAARGNAFQIARIEKEYEALKIQREATRLDLEKAAKEKERAALEKEIKEKHAQIAAMGIGADDKHQRTMGDLKKEFDEAIKFIRENQNEKGFWSQIGEGVRQTFQSAGWSPFGGLGRFKEQQKAEDDALRSDLERAQRIVREYIRLSGLEKDRNAKIEERNKLQSEAEKSGERYAQLSKEIEIADKEKARILGNMGILQAARNGQIDQHAWLSGSTSLDLTENQRKGAFAYNTNLTMENLTRNIDKNTAQATAKLTEIATKIGIKTALDINAPFN